MELTFCSLAPFWRLFLGLGWRVDDVIHINHQFLNPSGTLKNVGPSKPRKVLFGQTHTAVGWEEVTLLRTLLPLRWEGTVWEHGTPVKSRVLLG